MNFTKHFLSVLALGATISLLSTPVEAQGRYEPFTILASGSATCAATAGTNVAKTFDVRRQPSIPIQIELMADDAGAYTFTIPFQYSVDGSTYAAMASKSIAISFNGVAKQTIVTNVPTFGAGYLRIPHLTKATAAINITNIVIKGAYNTSSPAP